MHATPFVRTFMVAAFLAGSVGLSTGTAVPTGAVPDSPDTNAAPLSRVNSPDSLSLEEPRAPLSDRVVVYYFHRTLRCATCLKFETYTDEALRLTFAEQLGDGKLEWRVVNLDDPGNEHFEDDYYITENSVVVVEFRGGEQREWANLDAIWGFVADKPAFLSYIRSEVVACLGKVRTPEPTATGGARDTVAQPDEGTDRR